MSESQFINTYCKWVKNGYLKIKVKPLRCIHRLIYAAEGWHKRYDAYEKMLEAFVQYYNCEQPAYALNYKSPLQYKTEMGFYNLFALSTLC
ncbi:hypothetical protein HMPREF1987_01990 [Peptostreptococcaceae bacterium oral taxon 113 str. W5053]|nr:hypothetical protein HMPREF1987_01990 [Peptostreptococcaceae bacterium oral taxon 113 str. W5053]